MILGPAERAQSDADAPGPHTTVLAKGSCVGFYAAAGSGLQLLRGEAWVTEERSPEDRIVAGPAYYRIRGRGKVTVQAFGECVIVLPIEARGAPSLLYRIGQWLIRYNIVFGPWPRRV